MADTIALDRAECQAITAVLTGKCPASGRVSGWLLAEHNPTLMLQKNLGPEASGDIRKAPLGGFTECISAASGDIQNK